jgi:hypothetical protein
MLLFCSAFDGRPPLPYGQLALDLYQASHDEEELRQLERIEPVSL